jgi:hypothetical protein
MSNATEPPEAVKTTAEPARPESKLTTIASADHHLPRDFASVGARSDDARPAFTQQQSSLSAPSTPTTPRHHNPRLAAALEKDALERQTSYPDRPPLKRQYTRLANKDAHPWQHWGITLGLPMILLFDLVIPCIIYYTWYDSHRSEWQQDCRLWHSQGQICPMPKPQFDKDILGYAIICFGFGELWILVARVYRLFRHPQQCAPLLSRNRWELDATSWVYGVAMILALIPFVIGSSLVIPHLYLYSPSFIMGFLGILMAITTFVPFKIPIGINSHARGTALRPFIYYAAEDFIAVDGLQDREFRVRYNERWENNKSFRRLFVMLTLWWMLGVCVYIGCVSAVIWTVEFHIAFGLTLGILFSYIALWAAATYAWVMFEMHREREAFEAGKAAC